MSVCAACAAPLRAGSPTHGTYRIGSSAVTACSAACGHLALVGVLIGMPAQKRDIDTADLENPPAKSVAHDLPPDRANDLVRVQRWRDRVQAFVDNMTDNTNSYNVKEMLVTIGAPLNHDEMRTRLLALIAQLDALATAIISMADYDITIVEKVARTIIDDMLRQESLDELRGRGALDATSRLLAGQFPADLVPVVARFVRDEQFQEPIASTVITGGWSGSVSAVGNNFVYMRLNGTNTWAIDFSGKIIARILEFNDEVDTLVCVEPAKAHANGELWCVMNPATSIRFYQGNPALNVQTKNTRYVSEWINQKVLLDPVRNQAVAVLQFGYAEKFEFSVYDLERNQQPTLRAEYTDVVLFVEPIRSSITKVSYHVHNGYVIVVAAVKNAFQVPGLTSLVTMLHLESQTIRRFTLRPDVHIRILTSEWLVYFNVANALWQEERIIPTAVNSALETVHVVAISSLPLAQPHSLADVGTVRDGVTAVKNIALATRSFRNPARHPPFINRNRLYLTRNLPDKPRHVPNILDTYLLD